MYGFFMINKFTRIYIVFFACLGFAIFSQPVLASDNDKVAQGAQNFVDTMGQRALEFLANEDLSKDQKTKEFRKLLKNSFDMKTIGRFALGRYWRTSTKAQQQEYLKLFENMVVDVYSKRFDDYKGQGFEVSAARSDGKKDTIVQSFIIPNQGQKIKVDWRVRYKNNKYKVVDVIIEGVSMSVTQRSDFSSIIQRGGGDIEVLLANLEK